MALLTPFDSIGTGSRLGHIGSGAATEFASSDEIFIREGIEIISTNGTAIDGDATITFLDVAVSGVVVGNFGGTINLNASSATTDVFYDISVSQTGQIIGFGTDAIDIDGSNTNPGGDVTVSNAGLIQSNTISAIAIDNVDNIIIENSGSLTNVGATPDSALDLEADTILFANSGTLSASDTAYSSDGADDTIDNSGIINGTIVLSSASESGSIDTLNNTGEVNGAIQQAAGTLNRTDLTNLGSIRGDVSLADANDNVINSGTLNGALSLGLSGFGVNYVLNTGLITGQISAPDGSINRIENSGSIFGIELGNSTDRVTNQADGVIGSIATGAGTDTVTNEGTVDSVPGLGFFGSGSSGFVNLGDGNDTYIGGENSLVRDFVNGGSGIDDLTGGGRDDRLDGGLGDDILNGGSGNDLLRGSGGADNLNGGDGIDTADYFLSDAIRVRLDQGRGFNGDAEGDVYANIEVVNGSGNGDVLIANRFGNTTLNGGDGNDSLVGVNGEDALFGGAGNDRLQGLADADTLDGGDGFDTADYRRSPDAVTINLADRVGFGGDAEEDVIVNVEQILGSAFNDILTANESGTTLLQGFNGNDRFVSLGGDDRFIGGTNSDTFVFSNNFGTDRIDDFNTASSGERIDLSAVSAITDFTDLSANHLTQVAGNSLITVGGDTITLLGVTNAALAADDFIF